MSFDSSNSPFGGSSSPGSAGGITQSGQPSYAPTYLLWVAIGLSLVAGVGVFLTPFALMPRVLAWVVAVVAIFAVSAYLLMDTSKRSAGQYIERSTDAFWFRTAIVLGLGAVVLTSVMFGLYWGRA